MHDSLKESNEIDNNLYPALLQVFVIILFGYLAGSFQILNKSQSLGLNRFVSTFSLPALLFRNIAMLDFNSVNWLFMASIFLSKLIVFILAIVITMITFKPRNLGLAAVFGIFCTQSNDFALGYPIVNAIYSKTHPDYLHYIYLLAPISLCILNPFGFMLMEVNEIISKEKSNEQKNNIQKSLKKSGHDELIDGQIIDDHEDEDKEDGSPDLSVDIDSVSQNNDETLGFDEKLDHIKNKNQKVLNAAAVAATSSTSSVLNVVTEPISKIQLLKTTIWSTFTNPIVFMTLIGIAANFILKRQIPKLIDPILASLANSFSALALFYLGFTMVGRIKGLKFSSIVIIIILIFSKSLIYPLLNREIILHLTERLGSKLSNNGSVLNPNETDSLSTFGFLYGTFPTAPSLFFYIARFKQIGHEDLISSALVFGTLASAPLMMISGKMISLKYNASDVTNFEDIECKTAYGFSFLSWFCCIWVLYIFLASGRAFLKSHRYTFLLIIFQMINSLVHIIWSNLTTNVDKLSPIYGYLHVLFGLYFAFVTRCLPLSMLFNVISISNMMQHTKHRNRAFSRAINNLSNRGLFLYFIGFGLPFLTVFLCAVVGGIPEKQSMMISVGKRQIIISNVLIISIVFSIAYFMIFFVRSNNEKNSILNSIISSPNSNNNKNKKNYNSFSKENYERIENRTSSSTTLNQRNVSNNINSDNEETRLNDDDRHSPVSTHTQDNYIYVFDEQNGIEKLRNEYQLMQQISLIIILGFIGLMCFFFQMWILFDESKSGIFYEIELLDLTLLYGQGFFTFLIFGLDNEYIFAPVVFKIKEMLRIIEPFSLPPLDKLPIETVQICQKFDRKYKSRCIDEVVRNQRFHHKFHMNVLKGSDFVTWLVRNKLVKNRKNGRELGKKLVAGRVLHHVSHKRDFFDNFNLYKFDSALYFV